MAATEVIVLDLSDLGKKRALLQKLGALQGLHEISIKKRHRVRTNPQNAWYWACIVPALVHGIGEQWGDVVTGEQAHEMLKARFLTVDVRRVDEQSGEVRALCYVRSTAKLDTAEFCTYCEQCRDFVAEWFGIVVPDPGVFEEAP